MNEAEKKKVPMPFLLLAFSFESMIGGGAAIIACNLLHWYWAEPTKYQYVFFAVMQGGIASFALNAAAGMRPRIFND